MGEKGTRRLAQLQAVPSEFHRGPWSVPGCCEKSAVLWRSPCPAQLDLPWVAQGWCWPSSTAQLLPRLRGCPSFLSPRPPPPHTHPSQGQYPGPCILLLRLEPSGSGQLMRSESWV